ncbi:zinc transport system substrate-binding protein [Caloramator quimbayensis]|uniref:Zinc transport system substrate-binding protein n=1 Tax=Caloramator quimbayensis TaxID=1147123 RepID=A0A1T4WW74_9CLOT|nr:metal ABC transporter substrate-binding protein [Caloramator quimbayensis]SKA81499.1 zinc transport system substrate-binding protein [Caloramator quimbayensis]
MKRKVLLILIIIILISACACSRRSSTYTDETKKIAVCTSFYAMYDFSKKIGGDKINLINLVPSGIEPHDWEPSPKDIANLEKADVLIYNGAGMEGWIDKVINSLSNKKIIVVETSKKINLLQNEDSDEDLKYDPHVWLNPLNAKIQMEAIKDAFIKADPSNKDYYEKNFLENSAKLDELDKEYKNAVLSFKSKDIVVSHKAFGYLCSTYGLNQVAIEGMSADVEPTPSKMAEIVKFAKDNKVKYIFFEELISPKVAQVIANESGAETAVLNPFEGLNEEDIKKGKDYFSVMKENLEILKTALQ